jgi:DNA-binding GntR family transcriptional regulator
MAKEHPDQLIAALIEQHYGRHIDVVDQKVRAVLLSTEIARRLNAEPGRGRKPGGGVRDHSPG